MIKTGLDALADRSFDSLAGNSVGLLAHAASVDSKVRHAVYLMHEGGVRLSALFGPEHGVLGDAQDMEPIEEEADSVDRLTGARVHSLYGSDPRSLRPTAEMFEGLDVLVVDLQDVGARYYTFAATMGYALETASKTGVRVMVLDRPNPLGGLMRDIEGPPVDPGFRSFVGAFDIPIRHGLTIGEYALLWRAVHGLDVEIEVVKMEGWRREMAFEDTGLPWVLPSPNMPSVETAWVYPGMCLIEGTNLSEGRGTTRPFELWGAPFVDGVAVAQHAARAGIPGAILRPTYIRPTFHKWAGHRCGGVQVHVTDRGAFRPVRAGLVLIEAARALDLEVFAWRTEAYEFVGDRLAIDLLFGSDGPRLMLESGADPDEIISGWRNNELSFAERRAPFLLYPDRGR